MGVRGAFLLFIAVLNGRARGRRGGAGLAFVFGVMAVRRDVLGVSLPLHCDAFSFPAARARLTMRSLSCPPLSFLASPLPSFSSAKWPILFALWQLKSHTGVVAHIGTPPRPLR